MVFWNWLFSYKNLYTPHVNIITEGDKTICGNLQLPQIRRYPTTITQNSDMERKEGNTLNFYKPMAN